MEPKYCIRCGLFEKDARRTNGGDCHVMGKFYGNHKYVQDTINKIKNESQRKFQKIRRRDT